MTEAADRFRTQFDVSRETIERLEVYANLLTKWNKTINLVSKTTIESLWNRHFVDSAAVFPLASFGETKWVDIGSGAGFPGLVLAIMAKEKTPNTRLNCIETDLRKSEFLRTVVRSTDLQVGIVSRRIEETPPQNADTLFARALAPLNTLLNHAERHLSSGGAAVFHKGQDWKNEVVDAQKHWRFKFETSESLTDPSAALLKISEIERV